MRLTRGTSATRLLVAIAAASCALAACSGPADQAGPGAGPSASGSGPANTAAAATTASEALRSASATSTPSSAPSSTDLTSPAAGDPSAAAPSTPAPPAAATPQSAPAAGPASAPPTPGPAVPPGGLVTEADMTAAASAVAAMTVAERAGSVIMASSADAVGSDAVARLGLGGVILMGSGGEVDGTAAGTPEQVAEVTATLQAQRSAAQQGAPLLIATDQEYGDVTRLVNGFTEFPGASELAAISDDAAAAGAAEEVAAAAARELLAVGVTVDFAPDADILPTSGPSAIGDRSYGADPARAAALVAAAVRGYQSAGLAATIKHFPGIGRIGTDTHDALPTLDIDCAEWNEAEAVPLRAGVDAGVALVMTGHVLLPAVGAVDDPTSLSSSAVTDLLRGDGAGGCAGLGFDGIAVSDSLQMAPIADPYSSGEAAVLALAAGQDLVLMPVDPDAALAGVIDAVEAGELPGDRLSEAATRVYALRLATARSPRPGIEVVGSAAHEAVADRARAAG